MFLLRSAPYLSTTSSSSSTACGERQSMFVSFHLCFIVLRIFDIISTSCWSSSSFLSVAHIILTTAVFLNLNCFEKWIFVSSSQGKSLFWGSKSLSHRTCGIFTSNYWYLMHCLICEGTKVRNYVVLVCEIFGLEMWGVKFMTNIIVVLYIVQSKF